MSNYPSMGNWYNSAGVSSYTETGVNGNISQDPLFVNSLNNDYTLSPSSPSFTASEDGSSQGYQNRFELTNISYMNTFYCQWMSNFGLAPPWDYLWSNGTSEQELLISPTSDTSYTFSVINTPLNHSCSATINITVLPLISNLPDSISACDSVLICVDSIAGGSYSWNTSNILPPFSPSIGDFYGGGIVYYLDGNGGGLIVAPSDQSSGAEWGCFGITVAGADGVSIGTGSQNTIDIVNASCPANTSGSSIAANICDTLTLGGYSDWYLPSRDELQDMYNERVAINATANANGGSSFSTVYWTSTESSFPFAGNLNAWSQNLQTGGQSSTQDKYNNFSVRAIRTVSSFLSPPVATTNCVWVSNTSWNYITITTANGITATDSVYVSLNTPVSGFSSVSACDTYTWEGQTITSSGNLTHTYQNAAGCDSVHTLSVTINSTASSTTNPFICSGNSIVVGNSTYSITGIYVDSLLTVLGCDSIITTNLTVFGTTGSTTTESACDSYEWNGNTYNTTGIYTYETTNSNGCDSTATLDLTLSLLNVSDITTNTSCFGSFDGSVEINVIGGLEPYNYLWDSGDLTQDLIDVAAGNYILTVTDANLCVTTHNISINDPEELILNPFVTNASCEVSDDASIDITPYGGTMPYTYLWSNGQITEDLQNIQIGEYTVLLTDFNGCEKLESISVGFDGSDNCFFIPTLFTPNGDGIHDTWVIDGLDIYPDILVQVFNRWGQLLFESRGYTDAWDGTHNGNELPAGAYYYVIDLDNDTKPLNGAITIKR